MIREKICKGGENMPNERIKSFLEEQGVKRNEANRSVLSGT